MTTSVADRETLARDLISATQSKIKIDPSRELKDMPQGQILDEFRYLLDLQEQINSWSEKVGKKIADIKSEMIDRSLRESNEKFASDRLSVTVSESEKVSISGDWQEIQKQLIEKGYGFAVQRRITDKHIVEAFYAGDLRLPKGLSLISFMKTTQRRLKG